MIKFTSRKTLVTGATLSVVLNIVLLVCCLYLLKARDKLHHLVSLGHANLHLGVLSALESGQTDAAVKLLEIQLGGENAIVGADPNLTSQTQKVLDKLKEYRWKFGDPTKVGM